MFVEKKFHIQTDSNTFESLNTKIIREEIQIQYHPSQKSNDVFANENTVSKFDDIKRVSLRERSRQSTPSKRALNKSNF